jgi:hypothetical protein
VSKEVVMAKDKLATNLYTLLAQEATWANNLAQYLHHLKVNCLKRHNMITACVQHVISTCTPCGHHMLNM